MKFRQARRELPTLNLTPLIDIVFLLLIFFMVTTTFSRETRLLVSLPEAAGSPESSIESIEVLVDREGGYAINGRRLINTEVDSLVRGLELESGGDVSRGSGACRRRGSAASGCGLCDGSNRTCRIRKLEHRNARASRESTMTFIERAWYHKAKWLYALWPLHWLFTTLAARRTKATLGKSGELARPRSSGW